MMIATLGAIVRVLFFVFLVDVEELQNFTYSYISISTARLVSRIDAFGSLLKHSLAIHCTFTNS